MQTKGPVLEFYNFGAVNNRWPRSQPNPKKTIQSKDHAIHDMKENSYRKIEVGYFWKYKNNRDQQFK